jgi:hypothetical protein
MLWCPRVATPRARDEYATHKDKAIDGLGRDIDDGVGGIAGGVGIGTYALLVSVVGQKA